MKEILVWGDTLPQGYHKALMALNMQGELSDCADWNTTQKELALTISISQPLAEPMISRLFIGGPSELEQYRQEMLDGILDFEIERGNWAYTYHNRMVAPRDQIAFVISELKRNPSSRRAVVLVRDNSADMGSEDPACLQHIQYFVRAGKLDSIVTFRSNDACKATFMNAFALIMLQKRIADALGLPVGTYTHRANSFHCYEKDFEMLKGYCRRIEETPEDELTFDYEEGWKELMEDAKPKIAAMVEEIRARK